MRKLVLVLIAFIAVVTFVRELGAPSLASGSQMKAEPVSVMEIGQPMN